MSSRSICVVFCLICLAAAFGVAMGWMSFPLVAALILAAFFWVLGTVV